VLHVEVHPVRHVHLLRRTKATLLVVVLLGVLATPGSIGAQEDWRSTELDPSVWEDGPELEGSPMDYSYAGNPVLVIDVDYQPGHFQSNEQGQIIIEMFPMWAPITVENMIQHVEEGLYDGIFFHRVIDDFVTQAGDPTCTTVGVYPATFLSCGSGGTGETIPLEHDVNLSHVDGAIGMARGQDPDSADSQWYIAETEAHGLDPENRDDEGYATFGVVRDGMTHVRAIAEAPTSDEPTGTGIQNPFASAGRPLYEVHISSVRMLGVIAEEHATGQIEEPVSQGSSIGLGWLSFWNIYVIVGIVVFLCGGYWGGSIWSVFIPSTGKPGSLIDAKHVPIPAVLLPPHEADNEQGPGAS
jgi:cyclophilin family peptidyl-prolyl cis-trans isomerase